MSVFLPFREPSDKRRILSIDGGGVRGLIAIEVLAALEDTLRRRTGRQDLVLSDVFDFFAGTSTGAIVAAKLAIGGSVADGRAFFVNEVPAVFKNSWRNLMTARYDAEPLAQRLQHLYGNLRLGSDQFKALLLVVLQNASTGSRWILTNNPFAKYNDRALDDCNLNLELWRIIRASTAAPTYFPAKRIALGDDKAKDFVFVDGALSGLNNPAFRAVVTATTNTFGLNWRADPKSLFILSLGTGISPNAKAGIEPHQINFLHAAENVPKALLAGAEQEQDLLCRLFGDCIAGPPVDSELGDLIGESGPGPEKLFTYARLNFVMTDDGLAQLGLPDIAASSVEALDGVHALENLSRIGAQLAKRSLAEPILERLLD
ncbi:MAG: patatin-like phospholipase family protein [Pseudomonadota bacterium]